MKKIPPEVENLMWTLAESGNQQALDEFEARYPDLRTELTKRIMMVRSLRQNRPESHPALAIPRFAPVSPHQHAPSRTPYAVAVVFAVIAASALAYTFGPGARRVVVLPPPQTVNLSPIETPAPIVKNEGQSNNIPEATHPPKESAPGPLLTPNDTPPPQPAVEPKWEKARDVDMRTLPLLTVLKVVASEGGLTLELDPRMANPIISVDYKRESAADIIKDLGRTYGFTPLLSDDGSVIIVPAVAKGTQPPQEDNDGVRKEKVTEGNP